MENSREDLKAQHPLDWKGVTKSYPIKKVLTSKTFWTSAACAMIYTVYSVATGSEYMHLLGLATVFLQVLPNLLGFSLGGYALIIGFGNQLVLTKLSRPLKTKNYSLFQLISSIFAVSIVIQGIALLAVVATLLTSQFPTPAWYTKTHTMLINVVGLLLTSLACMHSVIQIPKMVVNVFNFGQLHHFVLRGEDQKNVRENADDRPEKSAE